LGVRKYMIEVFAIALFVSVVVWAGIYSVIMDSRVWVGFHTVNGESLANSFENNLGNWVAVQMIIYAILACFGLTMASWIFRDRAIVEDLREENVQLRKEISKVKSKAEEDSMK
jgi:hypothetical protein